MSHRLLLVGHGRLGRLVESLASKYKFEVAGVADSRSGSSASWPEADVAIDFSVAEAVPSTVVTLAARGTPIVLGTTGWQAAESQVRESAKGIGVVVAPNFAIGVNIFLAVAGRLAVLMASQPSFGGWIHELYAAPFGSNVFLWPFNLLFNAIEYISKPLSHSLRLFGNMYAGEIIFMLLGLWAATGLVGSIASAVLHLGWSIFHILIVVLQAYIFMMLTVVYVAMAHEHH